MPLQPGTTLGPYEIDTVAIKVLPEHDQVGHRVGASCQRRAAVRTVGNWRMLWQSIQSAR